MSTQSASSTRFKVGDFARINNSKWLALNHRLVEIEGQVQS